MASQDSLRAVGIPLVHGRFFNERDTKDTPRVLLINDGMARRYWPGEDAVGKRITFDDNPKESDWFRVVGVVGDVKDTPESKGAEPAFWWPVLQQPFPFANMTIVLRTNSAPQLLTEALRTNVRDLDPSLAVAHVRLLDRIAEEQFSTPRFALFLIGLLAALALLLAGIGVFGVSSLSGGQRMREFGIRMA